MSCKLTFIVLIATILYLVESSSDWLGVGNLKIFGGKVELSNPNGKLRSCMVD